MKVADIMSKSVLTVSPATPVRELWNAIFKRRFHAIPVVDKKKTVLGIIAEEDLLKPLYPQYSDIIDDLVSSHDFEDMEKKVNELTSLTAKDVMHKKVIFTRPNTPIMRALSRMIVRNVRQLPVLNEDNKLVGLVSKGDIFKSLFQMQMSKTRNLGQLRSTAKTTKR